MKKPRVRFAPSPTGYLHVGGLRTALYNYLFAKQHGGTFVLRIEDTDRNRFVEGAAEGLIDSLRWSGIDYDEGPGKEGDVGPYYQSERLDIYNKFAKQLIEEKKAYYCFCSAERLTALREEQQAKNEQPMYDKKCLHLSDDEIKKNLDEEKPYVVRLNVERGQKIIFDDLIRERVEFDTAVVDDQVLVKSDGYPTYHLANVVDDHLMGITHVIRGEEWLSSTPKHVLLYNYLNWELPEFAHLPLLLNPDKSKLSKRKGDVAVGDYRKKGYLKEALINFLALLGWNAGDDREFYQLGELIEAFDINRVHKAGAVFNVEKLNNLNGLHIREKSAKELLPLLKDEFIDSDFSAEDFSDDYLLEVIEAMKERISFVKDILTESSYFFTEPETYDEKAVKKRWKEDTPEQMRKLISAFEEMPEDNKESFEAALRGTAEKLEVGAGKLIHPTRLSISGVSHGPGMFDLLAILGRDKVVARMKKALERLV